MSVFSVGCLVVFLVAPTLSSLPAQEKATEPATGRSEAAAAALALTERYLVSRLALYHSSLDVYTDADSAGNWFVCRGQMSSSGDEDKVPAMFETSTDNPHSGVTCIQCQFKAGNDDNWGGWYFLNGTLTGTQTTPQLNWGTEPNAGVNLTGAKKLSFWARGQDGDEKVKFICLGVGTGVDGQPAFANPDSSEQLTTGVISLTREWTLHTIDVHAQKLGYVLGGFGWSATAADNPTGATFFLDDIQYDRETLSEPSFVVSYETPNQSEEFDRIDRNVAFSYDNAVTLIALLAGGKDAEAKRIADAFVYAQDHDRYFTDGRLRNAYTGGEHILFNGWLPYGKTLRNRTSGWYDVGRSTWLEDGYQMSTDTGNLAWIMLALLSYYEKHGGEEYLQTALSLGNWIENNCMDTRGHGGYRAGSYGIDAEATGEHSRYKSTEHNLDLYAAFSRLAIDAKNPVWKERATRAKEFVLSMWDPKECKFWTGTTPDGVHPNTTNVPMDIQAWALLSLKLADTKYVNALNFVETHSKVGGGYDYNTDRDGVWYEGTAHMAAAYMYLGNIRKASAVFNFLLPTQNQFSGGMYAASIDKLTTGFPTASGSPGYYYHRYHIGATAWLAIAESGINPFWYGKPTPAAEQASPKPAKSIKK